MKNKKLEASPFSAMFWNSCKKTCFIPIISFVFLFLSTLSNYIEINYTFASTTKDSMLKNTFGFFWTTVANLDFVVSILLVLFGVIAGISLFSFAQSKKHCNVIFSLGMSRKKSFSQSISAAFFRSALP